MADIVDLARNEIPEGPGPWVMVDIRRIVTPTTGGPRDADGGLTWYVDLDQPEDLKVAIHEATIEANKRDLTVVYVRGRNA